MSKIKFNLDLKIILVSVVLTHKGIKKVPMVLDTGASLVLISWEAAKAIGLEPEVSPERTEITTASGREIVPVVYISKVKALGKELSNAPAVVHDLPKNSFA